MSTRSALTIVGGVVGAYFGYPQLGLAIGALVGGAVDPQTIQGPKIGEVAAQTSAEGAPRTIVYGTMAVYGNVIETGPLIKTTSTETQGKGGPVAENEVAYRTYAIRICEGPISGVLRVWADNKLVYDVRPGSLMLAESAAWVQWVFFHLGDETQLPDVFLTANVNPDTPAYRGTAYATFLLQDLTDRRGSIPQYRFEVATTILPPSWDGYTWETKQLTSWSAQACIASGNGFVVATGTGDDVSWASSETDTWTTAALTPNGATSMAYGAGKFVAVLEGTNDYAWVTTSGGTWASIPTTTTFYKYGVAYGGGFFLIVGSPGLPGVDRVAIGTGDGTWAEHDVLDNVAGPIRYQGGVFVSMQASQVSVTSDGISWTQYACPSGGIDIAYAPSLSLYVLVRSGLGGSSVATSPNLSAWTVRSTPTAVYHAVAWSPELSLFAMVGDSGAFATSPDGINWTARTSMPSGSYTGVLWADHLGKFVAVSSGTSRIVMGDSVPAVVGEAVPLSEIVADIHDRCDIPESQYDVAELTDMVSGLALAGDYTGADAINSVRPLYFFDKSEHDKKLWYPKRGASVMDSWDIDDLTEVPDTTQREQALEVPKKLHLFYQHAISGYARVKATAASSSPDLMTTGEVTIEVPVVLDEDQAAQAADKAYKVTRAEINGTTEISIPLDIGIERVPSNPVGLTLRGMTRRLRIDSMSYADGVFKLSLKNDRQSAYTSNLTGVPIPPPTLPPSTIVGETVFAVLDIAARVDSEDDLNYLVAVTGESPAWHGARYQRSLDTGANWTTVQDITTASIIGYLQDDVPAASEDYTDTTNFVTVHLIREGQTLDSLTDAEFLSEGGAFALEKADGSFELMQYLDAVEDSAGDFTLTTLHRGLLNSGASAHTAGARFVMLARPTHIDAQASWIGMDLTHRAISLGDTADNTDNEETATFVGRSQLEWPVASFSLTRSGNNVTGTWVPRHRFGSDDYPVASVNFQGYRVTIVGTSTVTFDQTAQTFTYDVSAIGGGVTVSVSALNRITGAGPATSGTI